MVLTIVVDYVLTLKVLFLVLMVVSSEVVSFHNESHIFLSQTSQKNNFLTSPIGILYK